MTQFHHRRILEEVAGLGMPYPDQVVVSHGAALVVRGLRTEHRRGDIDIVTSAANMQYLKEQHGFVQTQKIISSHTSGAGRTITIQHDQTGRFDVHGWDFSHHRHTQTGNGRISLEELIANSDQDEATGIWVACLEIVLLTKLSTGRTKDEADIRMIQAYQQKNNH